VARGSGRTHGGSPLELGQRRGLRRLRSAAPLVLHGLGGGPYGREPLIAVLRAEGLRTLSPVLPGQEGPGPVMPASRRAATAEAGFGELASEGGPVAVVNSSTGGTPTSPPPRGETP
jgi:hypothetical protein